MFFGIFLCNIDIIDDVQLEDKLLAFGVILSWHIDSFQTEADLLTESFQVSIDRLRSVVEKLDGVIVKQPLEQNKPDKNVVMLPVTLLNNK